VRPDDDQTNTAARGCLIGVGVSALFWLVLALILLRC
jgi:hypothetical protein